MALAQEMVELVASEDKVALAVAMAVVVAMAVAVALAAWWLAGHGC
jgi:hypothetical protein